MRVLFLFFDGIGLGEHDSTNNPFAAVELPVLSTFTGGQAWLKDLNKVETDISVFVPTDSCLGVDGKPQSATGQATIMTGRNVPKMVGRHYGPKPTQEIRDIIIQYGLVKQIAAEGFRVGFLNAYPSSFLDAIEGGKRLPSSNQMAMIDAGVRLFDGAAFLEGRAIPVDFTGELWRGYPADNDAASLVWRTKMKRKDTPLRSPFEAGKHVAQLAAQYDFSFVDHWLTDYVGHRGTMEQATRLLSVIDGVIDGILSVWDTREDLIILTSDHGNMESLRERGHTTNDVPTLVIGDACHDFAGDLESLTDFAAAIKRLFSVS